MNNNNRIFGLEALRLLAMLMVVTLHVLMGGYWNQVVRCR